MNSSQFKCGCIIQRSYFNDRLGLNLEFGGGFVSGGKIGISYKL